jgi:hypothetical protein
MILRTLARALQTRLSGQGETIMKHMYIVAVALVMGFVGGAFGTLLMMRRMMTTPFNVVRAQEFELVDEQGHAVSFWGFNSNHCCPKQVVAL